MPYTVEVIRHADLAVVKTLGPFATERQADRVDGGVNINLNHAEFYTVVRPTPPTQDAQE